MSDDNYVHSFSDLEKFWEIRITQKKICISRTNLISDMTLHSQKPNKKKKLITSLRLDYSCIILSVIKEPVEFSLKWKLSRAE